MRPSRGFHDERSDARGSWVARESAVAFDPADVSRFLEFSAMSEFRDLSQSLEVAAATRRSTLPLPYSWSPISVEVPAGATEARLTVNILIPQACHPDDPRELAIRVRGFELHQDARRHQRAVERYDNRVLNAREMLEGRHSLSSTPTSLGIDLYGACNIKPPCVYCAWDESKALEGDEVDTPFTLDTLREWGPIFDRSTDLVNCSIGEPFMMKHFDDLLDAFAEGGKSLSMSTNGQILTDSNIQRLIGRPIDLYVSIDAATAETYATLRNRRFDLLINNVRRLIQAKGGRGRLPTVNVVFMPMKANLKELDAFVALCADLNVDHLVLRPLNFAEKVDLNWDRAGYRFEYEKELLPFADLVRASGRAAELCRQAGVPLSDQMDFGGDLGAQFSEWFEEGRRSAMSPAEAPPTATDAVPVARAVAASGADEPPPSLGTERLPVCTEPWKSLYILRRGILPCCHGGRPIAAMGEYREAWNSPLLREIRHELAHGRFHQYCHESPSCPIVRKAAVAETGQDPWSWPAITRRAKSIARRSSQQATWARQWAGIRLRRTFTEPDYALRQVRRLLGRRRD